MRWHTSRGIGLFAGKRRTKKRAHSASHVVSAESLESRILLDATGLTNPVATSIDRSNWQDVDGTDTSGVLHIGVTLDEATSSSVAVAVGQYAAHLDAGGSNETFELAPLKLRLVNFDSFETALHHGDYVGIYDNVIAGTWRSETLIGTEQRDLIVGAGGHDSIQGLGNDDILIGGSGNDRLDGGIGDDTFLVQGNGSGYDRFDGGDGADQAVATGSSTVIGVDGYANGIESFQGPGDTVIRDNWRSHTLDFSSTELIGISEVDAGSGNDTIAASNLSAATYRGGRGYDTLSAGAADTTWVFSGNRDGYDVFRNNGAATVVAKAESTGTVIGINGYANGVDVFEGHTTGDTIIRDTWRSRTLDFSATALINIAEVDAGSGNDIVVASDLSAATYRGGRGYDTLTAGERDTTWVVSGSADGYDTFHGNGAATVVARAEAEGTVIGVNGYANGVDVFEGHSTGDTIIRDSWRSRTLDFSSTELMNIAEVDAGSGNDTVVASDASAASYRGGRGYDTLVAGTADTTWVYSGNSDGYDAFRNNGDATVVARAESAGTVIGVNGYTNGVDAFEGHSAGDTIVRDTWRSKTLDFGATELNNIGEVDAGSGNDTLIASDLSTAAYRGGAGNDTLVAGTQPTTWLFSGEGDGLDSFQHNGNSNVRAVYDGPLPVDGETQGTTGTGLDQLVDVILNDPGLNRRISQDDIAAGAAAADSLNHIIVAAITETGLANDGGINTADMRDINEWIQTNRYSQWVELHGDDEGDAETGFHLVQNDGGTSYWFGANKAVDTVADGLYHIGFDIAGNRFLNEDGNRNVRVETAAYWLDSFLRDDLAAGKLGNTDVDPYTVPSTRTGLDRLVEIIVVDPGLDQNISTSDIMEGAQAADSMNEIIIEAITAMGLANDGDINAADVRDINTYIQTNHYDQWVELHGDDENNGDETGFHLVQNDGATTRLFDRNVANTVADGIYHLGFDIRGDNLLNEDGNRNARVETVATWLNSLLSDQLAAGTLSNPEVTPDAVATTKTGLDELVGIITSDPGLNRKIATSDIAAGAAAADALNNIIITAITETGSGNDGDIDVYDMHAINSYIQANHFDEWVELHGDDEANGEETGFHLVQNDGATSRLYANNAVNTVADGLYHIGFDIVSGRFLNEDGNKNVRVETAAVWLSDLLEGELETGGLVNEDLIPDPATIAAAEALVVDSVVMVTPDDYVEVTHTDALALANGTVAITFTADDVSGRKALFSKDAGGYGNGGHISAFIRNGRVEVRLQNTSKSAWLTSQTLIRPGESHHLAISFGNDGFRLYLDGKLETQRLGFTTGLDANSEDLAIGANTWARNSRRPNWTADYFDGTLQDFTIYDRALSRLEVASIGDVIATSGPTIGTTGTGIDRLVDIIIDDLELNRRIDQADITAGAAAADALNNIIIDAVVATGVANDGDINTADLRDVNTWIQTNRYSAWVDLHGDDEGDEETGFHLVQNDGARTRLFAQNAVNTVADGLYHIGFDIVKGRFLNEDGNNNVRVETAAWWLNELLEDDLETDTLKNADVNPYAQGTTGTGLDQLVTLITTDPSLNLRIPTSDITGGARAADAMNQIIIEAIRETGAANDDGISAADVRDLNAYIQAKHYADWVEHHGDDEGDEETGFHLVQNDGASSRLFDQNAVNTVADGLYHLGFDIRGNRLLNEDGNNNARVETIAWWLNELLADDLTKGSLKNSAVDHISGTTNTGLDHLVDLIANDPELNRRLPRSEIAEGAQAADRMNQLLIEAIRETGAANGDQIDKYDMININVYIQTEHRTEWVELHGDDEGNGEETGFHLVQNDGAATRLFAQNAVNTVADGLYHIGFDIERGSFHNEDGNRNLRLETAAHWLNQLLREDLTQGTLANRTADIDSVFAASNYDLEV